MKKSLNKLLQENKMLALKNLRSNLQRLKPKLRTIVKLPRY